MRDESYTETEYRRLEANLRYSVLELKILASELKQLLIDNKVEFNELVQKLYTDDGHTGNVYKKAPVEVLRYYENKAAEIMEEE